MTEILKPSVSNAAIAAVAAAQVQDENGASRTMQIAGEYPLSIYLDRREVVTLMTLGQMPESLAIGWLRNQRLANGIDEIEAVSVDWQVNAAAVIMRQNAPRARVAKGKDNNFRLRTGKCFRRFSGGNGRYYFAAQCESASGGVV